MLEIEESKLLSNETGKLIITYLQEKREGITISHILEFLQSKGTSVSSNLRNNVQSVLNNLTTLGFLDAVNAHYRCKSSETISQAVEETRSDSAVAGASGFRRGQPAAPRARKDSCCHCSKCQQQQRRALLAVSSSSCHCRRRIPAQASRRPSKSRPRRPPPPQKRLRRRRRGLPYKPQFKSKYKSRQYRRKRGRRTRR